MQPGDPHDSNGLAVGSLRERIDRIIAELIALRDELNGTIVPPEDAELRPGQLSRSDDLIEISTAVERFNRPADTLRYWCREEGCGRKIGGRWMVDPGAVRKKLNGG